jgi:hypothetical protein
VDKFPLMWRFSCGRGFTNIPYGTCLTFKTRCQVPWMYHSSASWHQKTLRKVSMEEEASVIVRLWEDNHFGYHRKGSHK